MKNIKIKLPISAYLTYLLVLTIMLSSVTLSKYVSTSTGSDSARVARFNVTFSDQSSENIQMNENDPSKNIYTFTVNNQSEVKIRYKIQVDGLSQGISYTVSDGKNEIQQDEYVALDAGASQGHTITFTAESGAQSSTGVKVKVLAEQVD